MNLLQFLLESNKIENVEGDIPLNHAKKSWDYLLAKDTLSIRSIKQAHFLLMEPFAAEHPGKWIGRWRTDDVVVGNRVCPRPEELQQLMLSWLITQADRTDQEEIRLAHVAFERIHPFLDGNGRIGRIIYNWQRVKAGHPIHVIQSANRGDYYEWFRE